MKFGDKLRAMRVARDWSQPHLAGLIGIEQSYLSKLENGKSVPSRETFQRILEVFEMDLESLIDGVNAKYLGDHLRHVPEIDSFLRNREQRAAHGRRRWLLFGAILGVIGFGLIFAGYFQVFFDDKAFMYKSKGVVKPGESKEIFDWSNNVVYHQMDPKKRREFTRNIQARFDEVYVVHNEFKGDMYNVPVSGGSRTFVKVSSRTERRKENRYLLLLGVVVLVSSLFGFFVEWRLSRK